MKLIDAEAVIEALSSRYSNTEEVLERLARGDFDPPKFSERAVDNLHCAIVDERRRAMCGASVPADHVTLSDHLIEYLTQLRESK